MNPWQLAHQLRKVLREVTWPTGSGDPVFGTDRVTIYAGPPDQKALPVGMPFALIQIGESTPDPNAPGLLTQTFDIGMAVQVFGDRLGAHAILGSSAPDLGKSEGRGSAEVKARAVSAIESLTGADGAAILVSGSGGTGPQVIAGRQCVFESVRVSAVCTSAEHYTAPQEFKRSGGILRWNGDQCSARFDFLQFRVGWVEGSTPAATPDDLDAVIFTGTATETAFSFAARRVYSVFADYDPRGTGSVARSSEAIVGSWVTA